MKFFYTKPQFLLKLAINTHTEAKQCFTYINKSEEIYHFKEGSKQPPASNYSCYRQFQNEVKIPFRYVHWITSWKLSGIEKMKYFDMFNMLNWPLKGAAGFYPLWVRRFGAYRHTLCIHVYFESVLCVSVRHIKYLFCG